MKVGVLGSGTVGQTLGAGFLKHAHQVMLGTRDPKKPDVQKWVQDTPGATAATFEETARFGELIVLATLGSVVENVIDLANPYNFTAVKGLYDVCAGNFRLNLLGQRFVRPGGELQYSVDRRVF
jgi:predicted dinucleotide-binding enzyme